MKSANRLSNQGFTLIEIMIAVVILSIGLVAMMAMQVVFVEGGATSRDISMATTIGESAVEQMRAEAVGWSRVNGTFSQSTQPMLYSVTQSLGAYQMVHGARAVTPTLLPRLDSSSGYANNSSVALDSAGINARYCVDVQARYLDATNTTLVGQVRVSWRTDGELPWANDDVTCTDAASMTGKLFPNGFGAEPAPTWNFVHVPFSIQQNNY